MSQNILLLYMSLYSVKPGASYRTQTNEAAVRVLMAKPETRPDRILALCSDSVRLNLTVCLPGRDGSSITTLAYMQDHFLPKVKLTPDALTVIEVPDSLDDQSRAQAIAQLIQQIHAGDSLYIDLSGGPRDAAMLMVTAARILRDLQQVEVRQVLYAELRVDQITPHDVTGLYDLYDLVSAIDEFFTTGSARGLQRYSTLKEISGDFAILLDAINQFSDHLALCQVEPLTSDLKAVRKALKSHLSLGKNLDDLFFDLLNQRFQTEFSALFADLKNTLPALVDWCTRHRLYQQALTLLNERMPDFFCEHILLQPTQKGMDYLNAQDPNNARPWTYPLFHFHFCQLRLMQGENCYTADLRASQKQNENRYTADSQTSQNMPNSSDSGLYRVATDDQITCYLDLLLALDEIQLDPGLRPEIQQAIRLYQGIIQYRNQINHASSKAQQLQLEGILPLNTAAIESLLTEASALLQKIAPLSPVFPEGTILRPVSELCCVI